MAKLVSHIRAIGLADIDQYKAFLAAVAREDLQLRVQGGLAEVSADAIDELLRPNGRFGDGYGAFDADGRLLAVLRASRSADAIEVALLTRSDHKRMGLASALVAHAISLAQSAKVSKVIARTATGNVAFIAFATRVGFTAKWDALERDMLLTMPIDSVTPEPPTPVPQALDPACVATRSDAHTPM